MSPSLQHRAAAFVASACAALAACQDVRETPVSDTRVMSVEEAKSVPVRIKDVVANAPQRTIAELERSFGPLQPVPADCASVRSERRALRERYSKESGLAQDGRWSRGTWEGFHTHFIDAQIGYGNYRSLEQQIQRRVSGLDTSQDDLRGKYLVQLTQLRASTGDVAGAKDAWSSARWAYGRSTARAAGWGGGGEIAAQRDFYLPLGQAAIAQAAGALPEAERLYRDTVNHVWAMWGSDRALLWSELAANLMQQGRLVEAEVEVRKAIEEEQRRGGGYSRKNGRSVARLAAILLEQERLRDARTMAAYAVNMHEADCTEPDSLSYAIALEVQARTLAAVGDWPRIVEIFERIEAAFSAQPETFDRVLRSNPDWALALMRTGSARRAVANLASGVGATRERYGDGSRELAELEGLLAAARLAAGDDAAARAGFERVAPVLMAGSGGSARVPGRFTRDLRRRLVLEHYMTLLERAGDVDTLFRVADAIRNDVVQRDVATSAVRSVSAATDPELAQLIRREQDATQRISAALEILANLSATAPAERDATQLARLRERVAELRTARDVLAGEIRSRFPRYAELVAPHAPGLDAVRASLRPDEALVAFYVARERTYVWAVPKSGRVAFVVAALGREAIDRRVAELRRALAPEVALIGDIPPFDVAGAHALFRELLAPVESGWRAARTLLLVTDGALRELPLHVLPTQVAGVPADRDALFDGYRSVPWLARSHALAELPSAATLVSLRGLAATRAARKPMAGFGDPWFRPGQSAAPARAADPAAIEPRRVALRRRSTVATRASESATSDDLAPLPDTAEETRAIALALGANAQDDVFLGPRASERNAKGPAVREREVLVFATHGLVPGDLDGLTEPALALSAPKVTGEAEDGLLTMSEILGLELDADWVVLSACNTAAGDGAGAMAVSGLGRAFFYAGARALLVTHWAVETGSARALTTAVFRDWKTDPDRSRALALKRAMLELIERGGARDAGGKLLFSYAHPIFWAPFAVVGDSSAR